MTREDLFLPVLHSFENGNTFTGSYGSMRFKATPNVVMLTPKEVNLPESSIRAEVWHGPLCYEKSEMEDERTFPMSEEGRAELHAWLKAHIAPEELAAAIEMIDLYEPLLQDCTAAGYAWREASGGADCTRRKPLPEGGCLHMKLDWLLPRGFTVHCSSVISTLTADCGFAAPDSALARYAQPELSDHNVVRASLALPQKEE